MGSWSVILEHLIHNYLWYWIIHLHVDTWKAILLHKEGHLDSCIVLYFIGHYFDYLYIVKYLVYCCL